MRFGPTDLDDAHRAILAHGFRVSGRMLKKGRRLAEADIAALRDAGYGSVVTARLDPDDVAENEAARALAEALAGAVRPPAPPPGSGAGGENAGTGLVTGTAFTGRCNLLATKRGVLCVDEEGVAEINAVGEELTLATLPPLTVVDPRRLAATVKVIPFAITRSHLDACLRVVARRGGIVRVAAFRPRRAGLVLTALPGTRPSILDKTTSVLRDKLAGVGATLEVERRCTHAEDDVASALADLVSADCDLALVLGASAIVDRRDIVPAAIERAGGTVHRLGLPVDPGNLCLYAGIGVMTVIGLPGSSRSPAASGADLLLRRVGAGLPLTERVFAAWGSGGLLKEQLGRPSPRSGPADAAGPPRPPSGQSRSSSSRRASRAAWAGATSC